jgi:hypothetical protein
LLFPLGLSGFYIAKAMYGSSVGTLPNRVAEISGLNPQPGHAIFSEASDCRRTMHFLGPRRTVYRQARTKKHHPDASRGRPRRLALRRRSIKRSASIIAGPLFDQWHGACFIPNRINGDPPLFSQTQ